MEPIYVARNLEDARAPRYASETLATCSGCSAALAVGPRTAEAMAAAPGCVVCHACAALVMMGGSPVVSLGGARVEPEAN